VAVAVVVGAGAVGARAARQLVGADAFEQVLVVDAAAPRADAVAQSLGPIARAATWSEARAAAPCVAVLAVPGDHRRWAEEVLDGGGDVVSTTGSRAGVAALLALDDDARRGGRTVVAGAGFAPGLSCLLARHAADGLDVIEEIHVARVGSGGPACTRDIVAAHAAGPGLDWHDGRWAPPPRRGGGELRWFPEPIAGRDCYPADVGDTALLVPAFPGVARVSTRIGASRRDRALRRLPPLRRPPAEGLMGAVWVEVRGRRGAITDSVVLGALDRPALAAGVVAGVVASWVQAGRIAGPGAAGLASLVPEPLSLLQELARRGVRAATFTGRDAGRAS
jgi:hypothetical protein